MHDGLKADLESVRKSGKGLPPVELIQAIEELGDRLGLDSICLGAGFNSIFCRLVGS